MRHAKLAVLVFALSATLAHAAVEQVLYNGSLGNLPAAQGWLYMPTPSPGSAVQAATPVGVLLDTTLVTTDRAGYFNAFLPGSPDMDCAAGFTVRIDLQLLAESHASADRAGFSLIVLDKNKKGLELEFWPGEVWAQHDAITGPDYFTHAEGVAFDTTAEMARYELAFFGGQYRLMIDGQWKMSGLVRDYTGYVGAIDPYETPNLLFFGDNGGSSSSSATISRLSYYGESIPEPASMSLLLLGTIGALARRKR